MHLSTVLIFVGLLCGAILAQGYLVTVEPGNKMCFFEYLSEGDRIGINYEVKPEANQKKTVDLEASLIRLAAANLPIFSVGCRFTRRAARTCFRLATKALARTISRQLLAASTITVL